MTSTHDIPQPLCSAYEHPNKETAIQVDLKINMIIAIIYKYIYKAN